MGKNLLDELLEIGFLTGSRAFGTAKSDSDWDVVYSIEDTKRIDKILEGYIRKDSEYFSGYYVIDGRRQINLIPVHCHDFLPWYLATKAMKATLKTSGINDPIRKYAIFQGMVALFKGTVTPWGKVYGYQPTKKKILDMEKTFV